MSIRNYSSTAAQTTLSSGVDASTTTLTVSATTGFPAAPFILAIDAGAAAQELVLVTNVAGTTLTVTRAFDSTVASAHDTGAVASHSHAAIDFREANAHVNATSGVHGRTGALVGTTDAQTLTGKTVSLADNTLSGTKAQFNAAVTDDNPVWAGEIGRWADWSPTFTGGWSLGNGVTAGRYVVIGKTVHFWGKIVLGSTSGVSGVPVCSIPVPARAATEFAGIDAFLLDSSSSSPYGAQARLTSATGVSVYAMTADGSLGAGLPFAAGADDMIEYRGTYEAA